MRIFRILGYVALFFFSLLLGIYLTFPWDALKDRILSQASTQSGWRLRADRMRPSWFTGVTLYGFEATPPEGGDPLKLKELTARAHLFAFLTGSYGGTVALPMGQGDVEATLRMSDAEQRIQAEVDGVELGLVPGLATVTGLPLTGEVDATVDLTLSTKNPADTSGTVTLKGSNLELDEGGTLGGFSVPALAVGNLDWTIAVQSGKAQISNQQIRGGAVDVDLDGTVSLANPLTRSTMDLNVSFRPTSELMKERPELEFVLNSIKQARGKDGFYTYAIVGPTKRPRTFPRPR